MSLVFGCPFCTKPFQVDESQAGQAVRCPSCMEAVTVPHPESKEDAAATQDVEPEPTKPSSPAEEPIALACPHCNGQFGVSQNMFGTKVACPHCAKPIEIKPPPNTEKTKQESASNDVDSGQKDSAKKQKFARESIVPKRRPDLKKKARFKGDPQTEPAVKPPNEVGKSTSKVGKESLESPASKRAMGGEEKHEAADRNVKAEKNDVGAGSAQADTAENENASGQAIAPDQVTNDESDSIERADQPEQVESDGYVRPNIDHLLPPTFDVIDPTRIGRLGSSDQVILPDGTGGLTSVDQRVVTIVHQGQEYQLVAMTPEQKRRRKLIHNIIALLIGALLIAWMLRFLE